MVVVVVVVIPLCSRASAKGALAQAWGSQSDAMSGGLLSASGTDSEQEIGQLVLLTESSPEADGHSEGPRSPEDGADAHVAFGPQNLSLEERKMHRAEVARRAKLAKAAEGVRLLSTPFTDLAHAAAVRGMLHSATLASRKVRAKTWKVDPKWLGSMTEVLAKILLDIEWSSWGELLSTIETAKEQGRVKPCHSHLCACTTRHRRPWGRTS